MIVLFLAVSNPAAVTLSSRAGCPRAKFTTRSIFPEQEALIDVADRIKVLGKREPGVHSGDLVEVEISRIEAQI